MRRNDTIAAATSIRGIAARLKDVALIAGNRARDERVKRQARRRWLDGAPVLGARRPSRGHGVDRRDSSRCGSTSRVKRTR
jgi:hypothetical protein